MFKANALREAAISIAASTTMGYERMKSEQLQIVESFATGHDVFGVLPTGYGKSVLRLSTISVCLHGDLSLRRTPSTTKPAFCSHEVIRVASLEAVD